MFVTLCHAVALVPMCLAGGVVVGEAREFPKWVLRGTNGEAEGGLMWRHVGVERRLSYGNEQVLERALPTTKDCAQ